MSSCGNPSIDPVYDEYRDSSYGTAHRPSCTDFRTNISTTHFTFSELNVSNQYTYGLFRVSLTDGVECIRRENGGSALTVNSGYRNPAKNQQIGGATESRHIYGDAVDFSAPAGSTLRTNVEASNDIKNNCGACREPLNLTATWVHFDWRGTCPANW